MINVLIYNARGHQFIWKWDDNNWPFVGDSVMDMTDKCDDFTFLDAAIINKKLREARERKEPGK